MTDLKLSSQRDSLRLKNFDWSLAVSSKRDVSHNYLVSMDLVSQNCLVLANLAETSQTDIGQIWIDQELNLDSIFSKESNFRLIFY